MSSDESTATHISAASSRKADSKDKLQHNKPERFEINLIGDFVLNLYHRSLIGLDNGWCPKKAYIRNLFDNFTNAEQRIKLKELAGTKNIGNFLQRCGFLINTQRGSDFYKIKYSELFKFRNDKLKELDALKMNGGNHKTLKIEMTNQKLLAEENFEIDDVVPKEVLEYQGTLTQERNSNHYPTNTSCCICEEDFATMDDFEEHIQKHGEETDFEYLFSLEEIYPSIFTLNYGLCKNSHYFYFEIETSKSDIIIEKIIIVQSRSFYYVDNMKVPYKLAKNDTYRFFVDSHMFTIHVEQPIVIIGSIESSKGARIIEQHHFMRSEKFPKINFRIEPYLSNKKVFKPKFCLPDYFPSNEIQNCLKDDFYHESLMKTSNEFRDYVQSGNKLQLQTIGLSLRILLQIEDLDTLNQYLSLTQQNINLRKFGKEYSFRLKTKRRLFIENILSAYDEVVLTTIKDISNKPDKIKQLIMLNKKDINDMTNTFVGQIIAINSGRIVFECDKTIDINVKYTVICRPSRLNVRYQYRSLELLSINMHKLRKFLFPTQIIPMPLSMVNLSLYNDKIALIPEQLQAVSNIAQGPRNDATYIIFGPPGTGKTTTLVESILQLLKKQDTKILVTASSNSACDEVAVRLIKYLKQSDLKRSIIRIYSRSAENRFDNIDNDLLEYSNMYNGQFYPDIETLHEFRIVVCTLSVVAKLSTGKFGRKADDTAVYTHLFIDEIAASMEAEALMAITAILTDKSHLIISGDHKQLGPILQSKRAQELGLDVSLMERLLERDCYRVDIDTGEYDRTIQTRLRRNYRSHPAIVNLYSGLYYNHNVEPYANIENVSLGEVWYKSKNKNYPIIFHAIYEPSMSDNQSNSLYNIRELQVVMEYVKDLMYFGINEKPVDENDIGIISPYKNQYRRIQEELNLRKWFNIETGSVETFQGKEKEIIIVSFVRSGTNSLGFLESSRRLNVTLSRPKSILILIGNPTTLSLNSEFDFIIKECQRHNTFVGTRKEQNNSQDILNKTLQKLRISSQNKNRKVDDEVVGASLDFVSKETNTSNRNRSGYRRRTKAKNNKKATGKSREGNEKSIDSEKPISTADVNSAQKRNQFNRRRGNKPNDASKILKQNNKASSQNKTVSNTRLATGSVSSMPKPVNSYISTTTSSNSLQYCSPYSQNARPPCNSYSSNLQSNNTNISLSTNTNNKGSNLGHSTKTTLASSASQYNNSVNSQNVRPTTTTNATILTSISTSSNSMQNRSTNSQSARPACNNYSNISLSTNTNRTGGTTKVSPISNTSHNNLIKSQNFRPATTRPTTIASSKESNIITSKGNEYNTNRNRTDNLRSATATVSGVHEVYDKNDTFTKVFNPSTSTPSVSNYDKQKTKNVKGDSKCIVS